jgi:hypothetical protein
MTMSNDDARVILAVAAEANDGFKTSKPQCSLPDLCKSNSPTSAAKVLRKSDPASQRAGSRMLTTCARSWTEAETIVSAARVADILEQALQEAQRAPVQAVVIVSDHFSSGHHAVALAKQLRKAGTKLFLFQQRSHAHSSDTEHMFRILAEETGGAFVPFNPAVERVAERLPSMLEAVTHFAIGGTRALAQAQDEAALLLLEQLER